MNNYFNKYLKYKNKYTQLKLTQQTGGQENFVLEPSFDSGNGDDQVKKNLALCEILNFQGINKMNINIIRQIYDPNVIVSLNGNVIAKNINEQLNNIKEMEIMAPGTKITGHDVQFGSGEWTAIVQTMNGVFTGKYKKPSGEIINGNGKSFNFKVCSIIRWRNNRIIEERVYSDEGNFNKQIGTLDCKQSGGNNDPRVDRNFKLYELFGQGADKQDFDLISKLIDDNVVTISTTGQKVIGKDQFIQNMKEMYNMAPDVKVISPDLQFGSGDWIAAIETMSGIFSKPSKTITGSIIQPTFKKFKMQSCSLMKWQNDKLVEFRPFWDQLTFAKQLGINDCDAFF